ncbi:MAG: hypothetical protein KTR29_05765 [Rhodothermaceae bacterium]|nr:hypothetical protein [Rhodothermaceae bacterium]
MNTPIAIAGGLTVLALLAHVFVGLKETYAVAPGKWAAKKDIKDFETVERNWIQALCAFQLVTIDLLIIPVLLFVIAFTELLEPRKTLTLILSGWFALWGVIWLIQLAVLQRPGKDYALLPQWVFCLVCAGLLFWGAQSV